MNIKNQVSSYQASSISEKRGSGIEKQGRGIGEEGSVKIYCSSDPLSSDNPSPLSPFFSGKLKTGNFFSVLLSVLFPVLVCLFGFTLGGCRHMTLTLKADYNSNRGQPVYVLIRSVNEKSFLTESYQDISNIIFKDPPDPSILSYDVILPGQKQKIKIEKPANASVGVYGLFSEPDEEWKMILPQPFHYRYLVTLERNRIVESTHE
jgi:hypothetical protein